MTLHRLLGAVAGLGLATSAASAGILPEGFSITCHLHGSDGTWNSGNNPDDFSVQYTDGGAMISGESVANSWSANWDSINYTTNPSLTTAWSFTNTTAFTQTFTVTFTSPISPIAGATIMNGSITGGLTNNLNGNGGEASISAPTGGSIYTAYVDGNAVSPTLFDDPFDVSTSSPDLVAPLGFESFSGAAGPFGATTSIAISHTFTLTAGDSVTFNSAFTIIPAPAGLAVFAMLGIVGQRRRRN